MSRDRYEDCPRSDGPPSGWLRSLNRAALAALLLLAVVGSGKLLERGCEAKRAMWTAQP